MANQDAATVGNYIMDSCGAVKKNDACRDFSQINIEMQETNDKAC